RRAAPPRGPSLPRPWGGRRDGARGRGRPVPRPPHPRRAVTAVEVASAVRARARSARDVLEEHLAVVEAREADLHACNLVIAEEARTTADAVDAAVARGLDPGPLAGVPVVLK